MGGVNGERLLILSRKGFDSGFGGRPSPVLPDGRMVSLPIPEDPSPVTFGDCLMDPGISVADLLKRLGVSHVRLERGGRKERLRATPELGAHLDPDLRVGGRLSRPPEWRPMFGQVGAAQGHLARHGVGPGDIFLFFGWFAHAVPGRGAELRYSPGDWFQAIWGWMEIAEALPAPLFATRHPWAWEQHPHLRTEVPRHYTHNTIYMAARDSSVTAGLPGAATLCYSDKARLTQPGRTPSCWQLPASFHPDHTKAPTTFHPPDRWSAPECGRVTLRSVARGQEFIVPINDGIQDWLADLLATATTW